jgi:hypothetical protein
MDLSLLGGRKFQEVRTKYLLENIVRVARNRIIIFLKMHSFKREKMLSGIGPEPMNTLAPGYNKFTFFALMKVVKISNPHIGQCIYMEIAVGKKLISWILLKMIL